MPALYQRARPVRFDQVVGQEHVIEVLEAAVRAGRISHAYLFSGPRGVGKTTTARLLAMAANCEVENAEKRPCGVCESCRLVRAGAHPDVTELDAASNNSVEDIRDLREKVGLAGLRGGMRVWILDEAHMLSRAAANALLKTLEEPPPGLLFILATTEPEKLPPTILSRCQHFRFRRLTDEEIEGKLTALCQEAETAFEPAALRLVARVADGGMRDAESMLERLLVLEGGVTAGVTEEALGLPPLERLQAMAAALAGAELGPLLSEADALYRAGFSPRTLAEQLGRTLREALVGSVRGEGFRVGIGDAALMRAIQALDDDMERFLRHNDLYALEVAIIKALNAARGDAPGPVERGAGAADARGVDSLTATPRGTAPEAPRATAEPAAVAPAGAEAAAVATDATEADATEADATATGPTAASAKGADAAPAERPAGPASASGEATSADPMFAEADTAEADTAEGDTGEADTGEADAGEGVAAEPTSAEADTPETERKPLAWREVKSKAGPQLKAFLKPAQESLEGDVMRLRYDDVHRFHHGQLLERADELAALLHEVAGPGYTVLVEGPEGGAPKKIA